MTSQSLLPLTLHTQNFYLRWSRTVIRAAITDRYLTVALCFLSLKCSCVCFVFVGVMLYEINWHLGENLEWFRFAVTRLSPNSRHWFTTSVLLGDGCRKVRLGVWLDPWHVLKSGKLHPPLKEHFLTLLCSHLLLVYPFRVDCFFVFSPPLPPSSPPLPPPLSLSFLILWYSINSRMPKFLSPLLSLLRVSGFSREQSII